MWEDNCRFDTTLAMHQPTYEVKGPDEHHVYALHINTIQYNIWFVECLGRKQLQITVIL